MSQELCTELYRSTGAPHRRIEEALVLRFGVGQMEITILKGDIFLPTYDEALRLAYKLDKVRGKGAHKIYGMFSQCAEDFEQPLELDDPPESESESESEPESNQPERHPKFPGVDFASDVAYEIARDANELSEESFESETGSGSEGSFTKADVLALIDAAASEEDEDEEDDEDGDPESSETEDEDGETEG